MTNENREKWKSIGYIGPRTRTVNKNDDQLTRDREAYKRLRDSGLQPPHVGGSADLERDATLPIEVEMGWTAKTKTGKALAGEGVERSQELGMRGPQ